MAASELIGCSPAFRGMLEQIELVAPAGCTVLLCGETGTGKELVARAIHAQGARSTGPYIKLNCAAMPAALVESEMFGHERGAYTGALTQTAGRFQLADRGTLFLDEVGDMPLEVQPKLLRVLQEQEFERLGSSRTIRVNVRVVAATNADLQEMVRDRRFRADLFYRLNVFPITLPPLRERSEDIPLLAEHFVRHFCEHMGKPVLRVSFDVMRRLQMYHWPGNIRELQNCIERAVILSPGPELRLPAGAFEQQVVNDSPSPFHSLAEAERVHIERVLRQTRGIVGGRNGAAARLGLPRTTLISRMQRLGIQQGSAVRGETAPPHEFRVEPRYVAHGSTAGNGYVALSSS